MTETGDIGERKVPCTISPEWNKTILAQQRIKERGFYEEADRESPKGYYLGRPIIGRDTAINGGVYLGGGEREAIVVDDSLPKSPLNNVYSELLAMRARAVQRGEHFKETLLSDVFDLVRHRLPYNERRVREIGAAIGIKPDQKVSLGVYITEKTGVCRHQALLVAYLLERLRNEGRVKGKVSVDRNYIPGIGGHAWVRYINSAGEVIIIDPARELIDDLQHIKPELRVFYERPQEQGFIRKLLKK
ncbi:hypothetical protein MUP46_01735 [Patescibacteria group bacterium]|nr:hypothetical protein [Patescibacteria group bacterium]